MTSPQPGHVMLSNTGSVFPMVDLRNSGAVDYLPSRSLEHKENTRSRFADDGGICMRNHDSPHVVHGNAEGSSLSPVEIGLPGDPCRSSQSHIMRNQQG